MCLLQTKPVPFEDKQHAVVYINSNCGTSSGRAEIMRHLMALNSSVPVHSLGRCDNNMPWPQGNPAKIDVQRRCVEVLCRRWSGQSRLHSLRSWHDELVTPAYAST